MNNEFTTNINYNGDSTDYLLLAAELALIKRQLTKLHSIDKILEPNNGATFVLSYLAENTVPVTPKEISQVMNISSARIAMILNQLEIKEFIERNPDPNNGRQTIVQILPDGTLQHAKNKEAYTKRAIEFLEALGIEDAVTYVRLQKKIVEIFSK
ncbi:MAG: MarR family winged helix-turn-helix transcriptional regulator [Lachnotalea sp.]